MSSLIDFDKKYNNKICGVDEAGRGPLAGPVVAAAVVINDFVDLKEINDSKKLSEKKREKLYDIILENHSVGIGVIDNIEIDNINILNATFKAMNLAISQINKEFDIVLVDGNKRIKNCNKRQECIIKGDGKSISIAAASIIAKVTRDRLMKDFSKSFPQYSFEKHKGYGTKLHRELIKQHGPCEIHRKKFIRNIITKTNEVNHTDSCKTLF